MSQILKNPPTFNPEGDDYLSWKKDIAVWKVIVGDDKKKQSGAAVYLSLQGTARDAVRDVDIDVLQTDTGLEDLIKLLDAVFLKDMSTQAFCAFRDFVEYKRSSGETFATFIVEFEKRYRKITQYKMELPTGAKAYFALQAANLTTDNERLARTTAKLDYDDMKKQIQKVFGDTVGFGDNTLPVKSEECFYTHSRGRGSGYRGGRGRGSSFPRRDDYSNRQEEREDNPYVRGRQLQCFNCQSTKHFANRCPQRKTTEEAQMSINITLLSGKGDVAQCYLMAECVGYGVLDTACTKTVAGTAWMEEYLASLTEQERVEVVKTERKTSSAYRFGDGVETRSVKTVDIPMLIPGNQLVKLEVDVVNNKIPLLISCPTMKKFGFVIDTKHDELHLEGTNDVLKLGSTVSGHYKMPICSTVKHNCNVTFNVDRLFGATTEVKKQKAMKLHRQMCHASSERLRRLLKNSGCTDDEFLKLVEECVQMCEFCRKYKKPFLKPVVGFPVAEVFNHVVCMDLKEVEKGKLWFLHLIDGATKYTAAALIESKKKEIVVDRIFQRWIAYFGAPKRLHSDCGGEFCNEVLEEMNEKLGIETSTTAGEAPFSNGLVERNNKIIYESMMKTMEDSKCDMSTALAWSVSAKNALQNVNGYSPNQLVFGMNVNLPSILTDKPPALGATQSELIQKKLSAIHTARQNFIKAESSERIKRALRHQVRTYSEEVYEPGDKVYFKRNDSKGWKGPARVLGLERNFALIRQGSRFYRCHPCQLMKVEPTAVAEKKVSFAQKPVFIGDKSDDDNDEETHTANDDTDEPSNTNVDEETVTVGEQTAGEQNTGEQSDEIESREQSSSDEHIIAGGGSSAETTVDRGQCNTGDTLESADTESSNTETSIDERQSDTGAILESAGTEGSTTFESVDTESLKDSSVRPIPKSMIEYQLADGNRGQATVLSKNKQPRATSKFKNWLNIRRVDANEDSSVNWDDILWWREKETEHVLVATLTDYLQDDERVINAKNTEMQNLQDNDVYEWIADNGQAAVSSRWVLTEKDLVDGKSIVKARLVARGFEESLTERTDSPTCSKQSLRMLFSTASTLNWDVKSIDIKAAFLQGDELDRDVFIVPPEDQSESGKIWKLKRCIYGLCDAPRSWYKRVKHELLDTLGGKVSKFDKAFFLWHDNEGNLRGIIALHVDDFVYCGTNEWLTNVIEPLMAIFKISKSVQRCFRYLGLNVVQTSDAIYIDQDDYVCDLGHVAISNDRSLQKDASLNKKEVKALRAVSGQLLWVSSNTRPDIAFDSCAVSNYGKSPTVKNLHDANKAIDKVKKSSLKLVFPDLGNPDLWKVKVYSDASHANLSNGASQGGYLVFIEGNGRLSPMVWRSKKLDRVTKSPLASEAMAFAEAADAGYLVAEMIKEVHGTTRKVIVNCYSDSKSLKDHLESSNIISDLRLRVDMARLQEMVELEEINVIWVKGKEQLADSLTKYGASAAMLMKVLGDGLHQ